MTKSSPTVFAAPAADSEQGEHSRTHGGSHGLLAKLRDSGRNPTLIRTMRGDGYMLAVPVTREEGQGDR